jgi:hypothetical protein
MTDTKLSTNKIHEGTTHIKIKCNIDKIYAFKKGVDTLGLGLDPTK